MKLLNEKIKNIIEKDSTYTERNDESIRYTYKKFRKRDKESVDHILMLLLGVSLEEVIDGKEKIDL